jgi:hypothetical protein
MNILSAVKVRTETRSAVLIRASGPYLSAPCIGINDYDDDLLWRVGNYRRSGQFGVEIGIVFDRGRFNA